MIDRRTNELVELLREIIPSRPDWRIGFTGNEYAQVRLSKATFEKAQAMLSEFVK